MAIGNGLFNRLSLSEEVQEVLPSEKFKEYMHAGLAKSVIEAETGHRRSLTV
jgi:hypothetical protein